ncbi:protein IWS1 homolog A [Cephus cinctus]|uniref:Protein IWS1 homolog A n=1 Tax=Cephus cinctus TaxID=211228 RepID=A0AAJ7CH74_CEPCN|nr:protein IWS1 homolog A [Cephus cinctus]
MKEIRKKSEASSTSSYSTSSLSSDDDAEACDLKPIKDYLFDRKELARQLFKSVKTEKIRMMLPQALKKMGLPELEEWCASELSGMSRARILCILNGQKMLESSESSDTDDSGPSLEIISDTEEWLTDEDVPNKEDELPSESKKLKIKKDKCKNKSKLHNQKSHDKDKLKGKVKGKHKTGDEPNAPEIKIKKEGEKLEKEKEGDSLLDLLELEMRARAIRALIRKEEDIIPTVPTDSANLSKATSSSIKSTSISKESSLTSKCIEGKLKELEMNCTQSEKLDNARVNIADDEDVVLVVQPTPTIELLSSGSEAEDQGTRRNKRLDNERLSHKEQMSNVSNKHTKSKNLESNKEEPPSNDNIAIAANNTQLEVSENISKHSNNINTDIRGNPLNVIVSTETNNLKMVSNKEISVEVNTNKEKKLFKKLKKKPRSRVKNKSTNNSIGSCVESKNTESNTLNKASTSTSRELSETTIPIEKVKQEAGNETSEANESQQNITNNTPKENQVPNTASILTMDEDKSGDLEEIIDLDDYPDDMDEIECADKNNTNNTENPDKLLNKSEQKKIQDATQVKPSSAETWATRYYQTDDVQSVIKESKIQSEIRKRLRERQRLARLNNSPNSNSVTTTPAPDIQTEKVELKTTGSVEEYLALKNISVTANLSSSSSSCSIVASEKDTVPDTNVTTANNDKRTTIKDAESTTVTSAVNNVINETNITNEPSTDFHPD